MEKETKEQELGKGNGLDISIRKMVLNDWNNKSLLCPHCKKYIHSEILYQEVNKHILKQGRTQAISEFKEIIDLSCDDDWYEDKDIYGGDHDLNEIVDMVKEEIKAKSLNK